MIFLLGLFLLSVANVKAQTLTQTDSLTMETMLHNLPEVMVKGSRPIVKAERGMLSYSMPLLLKQLPADNAYEALTAENGGYPPTQNGDIRSLFWLFSLMALQN